MSDELTPALRLVWEAALEAADVHGARLVWIYSNGRDIPGDGWIAIIERNGRQYDIPVWP
jgi:hypothetical protein